MTSNRYALFLLLAIALAGRAQSPSPETADATPSPRNVILIIGDGMDDQQITIARNYLKGMEGRLVLDSMPMRGTVQVLAYADTIAQSRRSDNIMTEIAATTCVGQIQAARGAAQQLHAEAVFQGRNPSTDRRLGGIEKIGGSSEAAGIHDSYERK